MDTLKFMKQKLMILVVLILLVLTVSCTSSQRARQFGGKVEVKINKGFKLEMVTWKDDDLWILVRPFRGGEVAETYTFFEKSSYGMVEGKVMIVEQDK